MLSRSIFLLSSSLTLTITPVYAEHSELDYVKALAKTIQYEEQHSDAIWPGFHLNKHPIIMQFINQRRAPVYAFQFNPKNAEWKSKTIENMQVYYRPDTYFSTGGYQFAFLTVEDQLALIFGVFIVDGDSNYINREINAITSYLFKDYMRNGSHFPIASIDHAAYTYAGYNNMENVALSKLEHESVNDYLTKNDIQFLKNYLAIHQTRMKMLSPEDVKFEEALELATGTPGYVRAKTSTRSDQDYTKEALEHYPNKPSSYDSCASLTEFYKIRSCLTGNHYSFIDYAAGYALDKMAKPGWKIEAETQGMGFTSLLTQYYTMDQNEVDQRVQQAKNLYGYETKLATLQNTMKNDLESMKTQLTAYQQSPGSEVSIEVTGCGVLNHSSFDKAYTVNSKMSFYTNYKAFNLCDGKNYRMSLNYDYIPYRFTKEEHNTDHSITELNTIKLSNDTLLVINDRQETIGSFIQAGKKEKFNRLLIENNQFMVRIIGLEGSLDGSNHALKMTLSKTDTKKKNHILLD